MSEREQWRGGRLGSASEADAPYYWDRALGEVHVMVDQLAEELRLAPAERQSSADDAVLRSAYDLASAAHAALAEVHLDLARDQLAGLRHLISDSFDHSPLGDRWLLVSRNLFGV